MSALTSLTIAAARDGLRKKSFSALELTNAYLAAMEKARGLNAYVIETPDKARAMASASDQRLARGEAGPLEGIPLGIKDLFATEGVHTQACSHVLSGFKPPYESTVSANLWRDGAVMLGKLNMDEFAMGSSNETSYYGNVINPWKRRNSNAALVPGGSSGGSAAAVAAHICAAATATDTGGSIRQPAAFTGTVGIKPTYGRCSRWGIVAFASSLDQAGPIARDVRDAAIMLKSMASVDPKDTTSVDVPVPDYEAAVGRPVKGLRVGLPREYRVDGMPAEIDALWQKGAEWLKEQGAEVVEISLPQHLCALGRLLRRLLCAGTEGPHADQARFRPGLGQGGCGPHARHAEPGLCTRRDHRPGADVSERHLHGDGEHGGTAGHRRPGRAFFRWPAAWPPACRQALRRGNTVPGGFSHRTVGGALRRDTLVVRKTRPCMARPGEVLQGAAKHVQILGCGTTLR